jgi:hypothetical protein
MRSLQRFGLLYGALACLAVARGRWGTRGEIAVIVSLLVACVILGVVEWHRNRALRRVVASLPLDEQISAIASDPGIRDAAAGDVFGNERRDWHWPLLRIVGPWLAIFYLPVLYSILAGDNFDGRIVMGLVVLGIVVWRFWIRRYIRRYRCPACRAPLPIISARPIRYVCVACATTWRL